MSFEITLPSGHIVRRLMFDPDFKEYSRLVEAMPDRGTLVEIGVYLGGSLASLAPIIKRKRLDVVAVDVFDVANYNEPNVMMDKTNMRARFDETMKAVGLSPLVIDRSQQSDYFQMRKHGLVGLADLVFIDGDHSYRWVLRDIVFASRVLKNNGVIAGHDFDSYHPDVIEAVTDIFNMDWKTNNTAVWSVAK